MTDEHVTAAEVDELVELMGEAASAYIRGDARRYFELMQHSDDFTLMDPFGGRRLASRARPKNGRCRRFSLVARSRVVGDEHRVQ